MDRKVVDGIPTIDVALVVIRTGTQEDGTEYAIRTASAVAVEVQTEETDAIRLIKNGRLLAQKPAETTVTGNQITITDNVFSPEVAKIIQGGEIGENSEGLPTYTPPVAGSGEKGEIFETDLYSAVYNAAGIITSYEKITYPNCQGQPFAVSTEDDTFRSPEIVINSMPATGEPPYKIEYVKNLPEFDVSAESPGISADIAMPVSSRTVAKVTKSTEVDTVK